MSNAGKWIPKANISIYNGNSKFEVSNTQMPPLKESNRNSLDPCVFVSMEMLAAACVRMPAPAGSFTMADCPLSETKGLASR
eukprot:2350662-Amphidinium_carterae.1